MTSSIYDIGKRFFLSRTTMLVLLVALLCSVLIASLIPQSFLTTGAELARWRQGVPLISPAAQVLGLHHVFTSPWFAVILLISLLSLALSAVEQALSAWRRTFRAPVTGVGPGIFVGSVAGVDAAARRQGYLRMPAEQGARYVKSPWGYWGNFLLHFGLVVTVASSLLIALTQQRASLVMVAGEPHYADEPWAVEENGLLADRFVFPHRVELVKVSPEFLASGKAGAIRSELKLTDAAGRDTVHAVAVNAMLPYDDVHIYQSTDFGHAFRVDFTAPTGEVHHFNVPIYHPQSMNGAGYRDLRLPISPARLEAKYIVDEERTSLMQGKQVLTLRLMEDERETGRAVLRPGESGRLGSFPVHLVGVTTWTDIIFVRITGMPGVFSGFALIILGTICTYCFPPREFRVLPSGNAYMLYWRAERFADFYADERDAVVAQVEKREG